MKKIYQQPKSRWVEMIDKETLLDMSYGGEGYVGDHGEAKFRRYNFAEYYDFDEEYFDSEE